MNVGACEFENILYSHRKNYCEEGKYNENSSKWNKQLTKLDKNELILQNKSTERTFLQIKQHRPVKRQFSEEHDVFCGYECHDVI